MGITSSIPLDVEYEPLCEGPILNIYEGVGVSPDATLQQIKAVYQSRSKSVHPDKQHFDSRSPSNNITTPLASSSIVTPLPGSNSNALDGDAAHNEQALLNKYKVTLESTHRRAFYDCVTTYRYPQLTQRERMIMYQKYRIEAYHNFLSSIREELSSSLPQTRSHLTTSSASTDTNVSNTSSSVANGKLIEGMQDIDGIFIIQAVYGDFVRDTTRLGNGANIPGSAIDVTWAVRQAIYNNNSGLSQVVEFQPESWDDWYHIDKTYKFNQGFYDPNFLIPNWDGSNRLYICYTRGDHVFQGIWEDGEAVILPSHEHYIDNPIFWTDSLSYYQQLQQNGPIAFVNAAEDFDPDQDTAPRQRNATPLFFDLPQLSQPFLDAALHIDGAIHTKEIVECSQIHSEQPTMQSNTNNNSNDINNNDDDDDNTTSPTPTSSTSTDSLMSSTFSTATHRSDVFLSSLAYLPYHLRGKPFGSMAGAIIPSDLWDHRMGKIKAKRRRNLYIAIGALFSTIFASLQWAGIIDLTRWTRALTNKGQNMIEYVQKYRDEKNEMTDI